MVLNPLLDVSPKREGRLPIIKTSGDPQETLLKKLETPKHRLAVLHPDASVPCGAFRETHMEGIRLAPTLCPVRRKPLPLLAPPPRPLGLTAWLMLPSSVHGEMLLCKSVVLFYVGLCATFSPPHTQLDSRLLLDSTPASSSSF